MWFLLLVLIGLLVWVARLHSRVRELEERAEESAIVLASVRQRLDGVTQPKPAQPVPAAPRPQPPALPAAVTRPDGPRTEPVRPPAPVPPPAVGVPRPATAPPPAASPAAASPPAVPPPPTVRPSPPVRPAAPSLAATGPGARGFDWEELIGVRLFSWAAGIALAVAAVFFLGYSIQQGWLQPPVRMAIGLAVGVGLLVGCELKAARRYPVTANALDGAAIVILFSTFFASYRLWELVGPVTAFAMLALVTVVAVLLSIRRDSVFIALLGLVGGFSTPALLTTGRDNPFGLFGYLLLLNAGLGWVAYRKRWPALVALSLFFTTVYQWGWVASFLTPGKLPVATAVFLAFPILGFVSLGLAGRIGALDTGGGPARRSWFEEAASLNAALPLLFALFMASSQAYGEHPRLLFGFLFSVDAGLFAVALWRGRSLLHVVGGVATLLVFVSWTSTNYLGTAATHSTGYPAILGFVAVFVLAYLAAGLTARHGARRIEGPGRLAVYSAPLLLFMFPTLAAGETAASAAALPFAVLFFLLVACSAFAIAEEDGIVYFVGAFLALAAEAAWSAHHLTSDTLPEALAVYGVFGMLLLGVPIVARRSQRPLQPAWLGGALLLAGIALLFFLSGEAVAPASLWGLAALLGVLSAATMIEGRASRFRALAIGGSALSWLVLGAWWLSGALPAQTVPALLVVAGFSLLTLAGQLWVGGADAAGDAAQGGMALALVGHLFLLSIAVQPSLSVPPWPMLGVLAILDVAIGAAALWTRRAESHAVALGLSQVILVAWTVRAGFGTWPTVALVAGGVVAALGLGFAAVASNRVAGQQSHEWFVGGAAGALLLGQVLVIFASLGPAPPGIVVLAAFHLLFLVSILGLSAVPGWRALDLTAVAFTAATTVIWQAAHPGPDHWMDVLVLAAPAYLAFLAYPLALGRRVGRETSPYLAAALASASFFHVARLSLVDGGYGDVIGALPVAQAALLGLLLAFLLRIEPPGGRTLGRLALVAGASLAFITVAIPLQLEREWVTIGWALECAALAWLFRRLPHRGLFWSAVALLVVVFVRLALNPEVLVYQPRSEIRVFNWYLYTYLTCAAAMLAAGWLFAKTDDTIAQPLRASQLAPAGATVLLFLLLNIEIADFFATGNTITFNLSAGLAQNLTYTLGWGVFAVCLLVVGIAIRSHAARVGAIVLLTVAVLKGFLSDVSRLPGLYRVMSFVGLAVCLALVAVVLQRFVLSPRVRERRE